MTRMHDVSSPTPVEGEEASPASDWLERAEARLIEAAIPLAPSLGWNARLVDAAAREAELWPGEAKLVAPNGARDLAALLSRRHDRRRCRRWAGSMLRP